MTHINVRKQLFIVISACLAILPASAAPKDKGPAFTTDFQLENCTFSALGSNPFFILDGGRLVLEGDDAGELERVEITVTSDLEPIELPGIGTVITRVVEERETLNGVLVEVSRNFLATCGETNDVFYFGEDVDIYHDDGTVTHDGAWRAGEPDADGVAEAGIMMPGRFLLGARYFQEIAEGTAMDRAENAEMGLHVSTPAGEFDDCVRVVETTPLEPKGVSIKLYCPGVGIVFDIGAELVELRALVRAGSAGRHSERPTAAA